MLAGTIPGVCILLYDAIKNGKLGATVAFLVILYIIIPGFLAGVSGLFIGAGILNEKEVVNGRQAAARGLYVSIAAWLAYVPILSAMAGANLNTTFLYRLTVILLFGSVLVGWLIAGVGIGSGLILYRLRKLHQTV